MVVKTVAEVRNFFHGCLHDPANPRAHAINGVLAFFIIFSIAVIPLHFMPNLAWLHDELYRFDQITVTIFTVEYLLRIWSDKRPLRFLVSWEGIVDLLAILPFFLAKLGLLASFEMFLVLRILRILKFSTMYGYEQEALARCKAKRHGKFYSLKDETVERVIQKHPIIFLLNLIVPLIFTSTGLLIFLSARGTEWAGMGIAFGVLFFFFAGAFFIKAWLDYTYDVIYITNQRVILQNHELFGSSTNGIMYDSITNVAPNNLGFIRWALGLGHIEIETANRDATLIFENAQHPHKVVQQISENRAEKMRRDQQKAIKNIEENLNGNGVNHGKSGNGKTTF
ncbi:MAG: ion transporter [Candidatus Gracilibacteria bacterium]|nr:ion transporter [Candidatus Gracilibacteria bacterium]